VGVCTRVQICEGRGGYRKGESSRTREPGKTAARGGGRGKAGRGIKGAQCRGRNQGEPRPGVVAREDKKKEKGPRMLKKRVGTGGGVERGGALKKTSPTRSQTLIKRKKGDNHGPLERKGGEGVEEKKKR